MGVHLYTNGAWTDSGKIYRNSLNLFDTQLTEGYYGASPENYYQFTSDNKYRSFTMQLPAGTYSITVLANESIRLLRVNNDIDGAVNTTTVDEPFSFILTENTTIYVSFRNSDTTDSFTNLTIMLNAGDPLPYEPYNIVDWYTNNGHGYSSGAWD